MYVGRIYVRVINTLKESKAATDTKFKIVVVRWRKDSIMLGKAH